MLKTEAIKKFLTSSPYPIAKLYTENMEVQVNVAPGLGELIEGKFAGRDWRGYTDGLTTWKSFRVPWNAKTEPRYEDRKITWDISEHAEAIGMTGWDWKNQISRWVAFDFDSIIEHKQGLTKDELGIIETALSSIPFVTLYTSTHGGGLHVYVFLSDTNTRTINHVEHGAVAKSILAKLSALSGIDLTAKVDTLGGNMWVWHKEAKPKTSFCLIKRGTELKEIPQGWRAHCVSVSQNKLTPSTLTNEDLLATSQRHIELDSQHKRLIKWFEKSSAMWDWQTDKHMLICHTFDLKRAHSDISAVGFFDTVATGREQGHDWNCFAFPLAKGAWIVRRYNKGTIEHQSWTTDSNGWTSTYYNKLPSLRSASIATGGVEGEKEYNFPTLRIAHRTLLSMGILFDIPINCGERRSEIKQATEGKIVLSFDRHDDDEEIIGWIKKPKLWQRIFHHPVIEDIEVPDHLIRHLISEGSEIGWFIYDNNHWIMEGRVNVISVLKAMGYKPKEIEPIVGKCIIHNWRLVSEPFCSEYPGNRRWNKGAPQLRFDPINGKHIHWDLILKHLGRGLDDYCSKQRWCREHGIHSGNLYLLTWIAAFIQSPTRPLPYVVFTGKQNTGKSIFHESLSLLFTKGYIRADNALTNPSGFNGELTNAILCVVEETNLSKRGYAADRIKDWVTGQTISIHAKHKQPYDVTNCTHWIQCTNDPSYVPVLPGDTRIVVIKVESLPEDKEISKPILLERCSKEAPAFIHTLINYHIPEYEGRLRIPVIETEIKTRMQDMQEKDVDAFFKERMIRTEGSNVLFSDVYQSFLQSLGTEEAMKWSSRRFSKELDRLEVKKDRSGAGGSLHIIGWKMI